MSEIVNSKFANVAFMLSKPEFWNFETTTQWMDIPHFGRVAWIRVDNGTESETRKLIHVFENLFLSAIQKFNLSNTFIVLWI